MADPKRRRRLVAGATLIVLGLALFALDRFEGLGSAAIFFVVGAAFLAAYLARREYGFLVPAGLLLGLGLGRAGAGTLLDFSDNPVLFGLGCGFAAIWLIDLVYARRNQWWPLIPGTVLILLGLPVDGVYYLLDHWPLLLIAAGLMLLVTAFFPGRGPARRRRDEGGGKG
jgi:hypothetical protein